MKEGLKILVAYDGSTYAKKALSEAIDIARKFSGSITALHVYWDPSKGVGGPPEARRTQRFEETELRDQPDIQLMEEVEKSLKASKVKYEIRSEHSEHPPDVILRVAKDEKFDCIALGSRGLGGAKAWLLGSVSTKVAAEAGCTVMIAK
jgi:nucleotide-binding universal stress UspA family protein